MHILPRFILLGWLLAGTATIGKAASPDSLVTALNKTAFIKGDTISWHCALPDFDQSNNAATIQLWIENVLTRQRWQYRYPIINGTADGDVVVGADIPDGNYALSFLLQKSFFKAEGRLKDARRKDTAVRYMLIAKDKEMIVKAAPLATGGRFSVGKYLFEDTALLIFSPARRKAGNDLWIDLVTPLDSAFTPAAVRTSFITVGKVSGTASEAAKAAESRYQPDIAGIMSDAKQLAQVVVTGRANRQLEAFSRDRISGQFSGSNDLTFDGLDNPDISRSIDLYTFLIAHAPGLMLKRDDETGTQELFYRNAAVSVFINEFKTEYDVLESINPADVAVIKVLRPGNNLVGGPGGAIAIYTKAGAYAGGDATRRYTFNIRGYNALTTLWK